MVSILLVFIEDKLGSVEEKLWSRFCWFLSNNWGKVTFCAFFYFFFLWMCDHNICIIVKHVGTTYCY